MKHITTIVALMMALTVSASTHCSENWKEKMMCEKIAFLSVELDLTPEEAQTFWPVYNSVQKEKDAATGNVFRTFKALNEAIKAGRPEKEVGPLLDNYLKALEAQRKIENEAAEKYRKVLPTGKVAKLYIGEEKFRRQNIRKLHDRPEQKK